MGTHLENQPADSEVPSLAECEAGKAIVEKQIFQSRVAIAQITTDPGDIEGNTQKIISAIRQAKQHDCSLVVFSETTVTGYCSMDLLYNPEYLNDNLEAIKQIAKETEGITAVVGFVDVDHESKRSGKRPLLYNSAAIIHDGEVIGIQDKSLLPDYEIFFEDRYYSKARSSNIIQIDGVKVGVTVCEDLWAEEEGYSENPTEKLVAQGAEVILNLSASPFHVGKQRVREDIVCGVAKEHHIPVIYANMVGAFDGYEGEVVFDGRSFAANSNGEVVSRAAGFKEELLIVDLQTKEALKNVYADEIEELHDALVLGIREYFRRIDGDSTENKLQAIIGVSGGIDSAVVAALAVEALGADRVLGITMPSKYSSTETRSDAEILANNLGMRIKTIPIQVPVDAILEAVNQDDDLRKLPEGVAEENVQARVRMIDLMFFANKMNGIVLNTGNKTELALNNCTIYGDMVGGFSVLGDVDKDRVYELANHINQRAGKELIPVDTITRVPTAELKPNQSDSDVMGGDPRILAPMVRDIIESNLTVSQTLKRYGDQFSEELIRKIFFKLDISEWKRRQAAPGIRVTSHAFGNGRRVPIGHGYHK